MAAAIIVTVILSLMVALDVRSSNVRSERTCSGIKVEFADQKGLDFVTEKDVRKYVDEVCGTCSGKRVEELDLAGIEAHVDGKSAVKKSEVYVTKDGVLHVMISQRDSPLLPVAGIRTRTATCSRCRRITRPVCLSLTEMCR